MAIIFGLAVVGFGLFTLWRNVQLRIKGIFTMGTITNIQRHRRVPHVFVSFKTLKKKTIVFRAGGWSQIYTSPFYQEGNPVPVLYDPNNPKDAVIYTVDFMWLLPLAFIGVGLFFIYQGL
jgi:hypothetical protein